MGVNESVMLCFPSLSWYAVVVVMGNKAHML